MSSPAKAGEVVRAFWKRRVRVESFTCRSFMPLGGAVVQHHAKWGTRCLLRNVRRVPAPVDPQVLMDRSLTLSGGVLWHYLTSRDERNRRAGRLFEWIRSGKLLVEPRPPSPSPTEDPRTSFSRAGVVPERFS